MFFEEIRVNRVFKINSNISAFLLKTNIFIDWNKQFTVENYWIFSWKVNSCCSQMSIVSSLFIEENPMLCVKMCFNTYDNVISFHVKAEHVNRMKHITYAKITSIVSMKNDFLMYSHVSEKCPFIEENGTFFSHLCTKISFKVCHKYITFYINTDIWMTWNTYKTVK